MSKIFEHTQVALPEDAVFKISPSQIAKFFEYPVIWYKEEVLGDKQFKGNTATVLGTAVHYVAEQYALSKMNKTELDTDAIAEQIETELDELDNPDVNHGDVLSLYQEMSSALINEYLAHNIPTEVESELVMPVKKGIYLGGSCDNFTNGTVVDYKNVGTKPNTDKIPWSYYIQLMAYAKMYQSQGKHVDRIRLVYTVRPTKTLPVRVFTVTQSITDKDWKAIDNVLTLITDTILLSQELPNLTYLLFKSMQLKD